MVRCRYQLNRLETDILLIKDAGYSRSAGIDTYHRLFHANFIITNNSNVTQMFGYVFTDENLTVERFNSPIIFAPYTRKKVQIKIKFIIAKYEEALIPQLLFEHLSVNMTCVLHNPVNILTNSKGCIITLAMQLKETAPNDFDFGLEKFITKIADNN